MSLLPLLLDELDTFRRPAELFDQHFGVPLLRDDILAPVSLWTHPSHAPMLSARYLRPWRAVQQAQSGVSHLVSDKDGFKVNLDVQQFKPDELSVNVVDGQVVIEGKHEERADEHGYVRREFTRRYALPESVDPETVTSSLSSDGVLMVSAPKKALPAPAGQRPVPITQTNAPAVKHHPEGAAQKQVKEKQVKEGDKIES